MEEDRMKFKMVSALAFLIVVLVFGYSACAETVQTAPETFTFMDFTFGSRLSEVQKELCALGFNRTYVYRLNTSDLRTRIFCSSHQDEMLDIGLVYASASNAGKDISLDLAYKSYGHRAYSVGGIGVSRINLFFSPYRKTPNGFEAIKNEQEYWLYAGSYAFDYRGNTARQDSYKTYTTLLAKLTTIYGVPYIAEGEKTVDGQNMITEHAIWCGENETGIMLQYYPVRAQYFVVFLVYGDTGIHELCVDVDEYLHMKTQREGL